MAMAGLPSGPMALHRQLCRQQSSALSAVSAFSKPAGALASRQSRRCMGDITITRTGKPILRTRGGRSSLGGHTATVFGATGFLGRYIVNRLARQGITVIIPYREEMAKRHLKVSGDLGRVNFIESDLRNTASIEEAVRHSDIVYNLVGRNYPTKNFDLEDVHVEGTHRIASAVAKYDVDRFIHVSSHSVHPESPSEFYRTKWQSEQVARDIFPETTIVRPAPMFGFEDRLLHRLAGVSNVLTSNNMEERFWPVHAIDVGRALEKIGLDDSTAGQTFELFGPKNYSMKEISELVDREIVKKRRHVNLPKAIAAPLFGVLNKLLWWPVGSADEVEREYLDQFIDKNAKTFKDLDIEPGDIANFTFKYLQAYRSSSYFDLPPMTEREKREEKKYLHVLDDQ
ncbi:NADH-ubiquinone oxidoreductase 40 kDa subunit, mitochondrial [Acrodontium crateriforme]|uniref:NADH-ubiquinone oxidoreductase 40 kDa subunit, mitochondrial n=1 Tax=Acrodontium crateriforme TaxID=150365 RepID=A0AAQ3MB21_9PEZI|nr:NADH-ubiquinone oxidoreductase 40 kDa subunit, mitochondrial [Acrodontium crateriforme]